MLPLVLWPLQIIITLLFIMEHSPDSPRSRDADQDGNTAYNKHEEDVEKQSGCEDRGSNIKDPNVVDWEGPDDAENPMNWPLAKKMTAIGIASLITLLS